LTFYQSPFEKNAILSLGVRFTIRVRIGSGSQLGLGVRVRVRDSFTVRVRG
jgi:hypothetical protein